MSEGDFVLQYFGGHFVQGGFCPGGVLSGGILSRGDYVLDSVCEIFGFKLYYDLETGVRGHSRSSKADLSIEHIRLCIRFL